MKKAVRSVYNNINNYKYVMKTDVRKYYASMDHNVLFEIIERHITEKRLLRLIYQHLKRIEYSGGHWQDGREVQPVEMELMVLKRFQITGTLRSQTTFGDG